MTTLAVSNSAKAQYIAVAAAADAQFVLPMEPGQLYEFVANVDCWVVIEATGGAAAANADTNILYVGQKLYLKSPDSGIATTNSFVHVFGDGVAGDSCLYQVEKS